MNNSDLHALFKRYKKAILIGGISLFAVISLLIVSAGIFVYKTAEMASDRIKTWDSEETLSQVKLPEPGFVEAVVLNMASGWLEQGLASSEAKLVKEGLFCFDAIGGPRPADIVTYVKNRTPDENLRARLSQLNEELNSSSGATNGPAACAMWIFNS